MNVKNIFKKTYYNFIGTIRVIFDKYIVELVPGHSKNYIPADKLSFNFSIFLIFDNISGPTE